MKSINRNLWIGSRPIFAALLVGLTTAGLAQQESQSKKNPDQDGTQQPQRTTEQQQDASAETKQHARRQQNQQQTAGAKEGANAPEAQNQRQKDRQNARHSTPQSGTLTDADIAAAVKGDLSFDSAVHADKIEVQSMGGTLTLTGTVPNLLSKERAGMVAEAVRGVRSVINRIEVQTPQRSDDEIRGDVLEALRHDPTADAYEIAVAAQNGVVTLSKSVDSWQERDLAAAVASRVKGVREVINRLEIEPKTERADSEVAADIKSALDWDVWVRSNIEVEVKDGRVSLSGTVGSVAEKNRARYDAFVAGVKSVDESGLNVDPARKTADMAKNRTPEEIERAVKDAFLFDPRVNSFNPEISVGADGALTLTGTVDNLKAKRAAQQIARNTKGVRTVDNQLQVTTEVGKDNQQLTKDIGEALKRDPFVERYEITVSADNGRVTLAGAVDSNFEKQQAEDVVSRINGVTQITNNLTVQQPTYTYYSWPYSRYNYEPFYIGNTGTNRNNGDDTTTAEAIRTEMFWSPFVDADQVDVSVANGIATLNGRVNNWGEYNAAVENAYEGGANRVESNLEVGR